MTAFDRIDAVTSQYPDLQVRPASAQEWQRRVIAGTTTIRELEALVRAVAEMARRHIPIDRHSPEA